MILRPRVPEHVKFPAKVTDIDGRVVDVSKLTQDKILILITIKVKRRECNNMHIIIIQILCQFLQSIYTYTTSLLFEKKTQQK